MCRFPKAWPRIPDLHFGGLQLLGLAAACRIAGERADSHIANRITQFDVMGAPDKPTVYLSKQTKRVKGAQQRLSPEEARALSSATNI